MDAVDDGELHTLAVEEGLRAAAIRTQIEKLQARARSHEVRQSQLVREALRRSFAATPFGRLIVEAVLPFLVAEEVLIWATASPAAAAQVCVPGVPSLRRVHHLRSVASNLTAEAATLVARGLHWASVRTMVVDLASSGWEHLLEAFLGDFEACRSDSDQGAVTASRSVQAWESPKFRRLRGLVLVFPAERPCGMSKKWHSTTSMLTRLARCMPGAPLCELVLGDLPSTDMLTAVLRDCGQQLRVCRASFIGPECRQVPLEFPASGLPSLQCLMIRHRDFCGQRASRQDRMTVPAASLLACLESIQNPERLRVLALAGVRADGNRKETAALLNCLPAFEGLASLALRFSVPSTFGELLPISTLLKLRCSWPRLGYITMGDMSLHGFDYWPEQMTEFRQLYHHGREPEPFEVFSNEFRNVLAAQYGTTVESQWAALQPESRSFWEKVATRLPKMPHGELRQRTAELFALSL